MSLHIIVFMWIKCVVGRVDIHSYSYRRFQNIFTQQLPSAIHTWHIIAVPKKTPYNTFSKQKNPLWLSPFLFFALKKERKKRLKAAKKRKKSLVSKPLTSLKNYMNFHYKSTRLYISICVDFIIFLKNKIYHNTSPPYQYDMFYNQKKSISLFQIFSVVMAYGHIAK